MIADERNRTELEAAGRTAEVVARARRGAVRGRARARASSCDADDPCLITFTSGTSGRAEGGRARAALPVRPAPAGHALAGRARGRARLVHGRRGWSKSARNVFIAPWLSGAAALLHDARFDPRRAPGAARARAGERAVHGAHRVPRDRQARDARRASGPARHGRRRRGAEPRGAARVAGGHGARDPRRLRPDRDRPADRDAARRAGADPARWGGRCRAWT